MAVHTVRFVVEVTIHEGHLAAFESIAREMVAGSEKEPDTLGYEWFVSDDHRRCRLIETYVDSNAVLAHLTGPVVQQLVPKALEHSTLDRFQVFGDPGPQAADMLAGLGAEIFGPWHGFSR